MLFEYTTGSQGIRKEKSLRDTTIKKGPRTNPCSSPETTDLLRSIYDPELFDPEQLFSLYYLSEMTIISSIQF